MLNKINDSNFWEPMRKNSEQLFATTDLQSISAITTSSETIEDKIKNFIINEYTPALLTALHNGRTIAQQTDLVKTIMLKEQKTQVVNKHTQYATADMLL